jgi:hypothetical protein
MLAVQLAFSVDRFHMPSADEALGIGLKCCADSPHSPVLTVDSPTISEALLGATRYTDEPHVVRDHTLMEWKGNQRAIGKLMTMPGEKGMPMGYEEFVRHFKTQDKDDDFFVGWFANMRRDLRQVISTLKTAGGSSFPRIAIIHATLIDLIKNVDKRGKDREALGWQTNWELEYATRHFAEYHRDCDNSTCTIARKLNTDCSKSSQNHNSPSRQSSWHRQAKDEACPEGLKSPPLRIHEIFSTMTQERVLFDMIDTTNDGNLSREEFDAFHRKVDKLSDSLQPKEPSQASSHIALDHVEPLVRNSPSCARYYSGSRTQY